MRKRFVLPVALLLAGASSAVAQDVRFNFDKQANFGSFKTYKWVALKGAQPMNSLVDQQIKASFDAELAKKGLTRSEGESADLLVGYQAAVDTEKEYTSYDTGWGYGPGWYGGGWYGHGGGGMTTGQTSTIYVGQIVFDMYQTTPQQLVWRGTAAKTLDPKANPDKQQKNLDKAVVKMLKNYPPVVKEARK